MQSVYPMRLMRLLSIVLSAIVLVACGNGDGKEPIPGTPQPTLTGVLVDSPVSGVTWETSTGNSGLTSDLGEFQYTQPESGTFVETVTFSIGDIVLGTVPGIPFKGDRLYVTAVELTNSFDPLDRAATNMLVFIQSIDSDGDPTNGITISDAAREAAVGETLDFDSPDFATEVAEVVEKIAPGNRVVTDTEALDHFYTTYAALGGTDTFDFLFPGYPPVGEDAGDFELIFADEFNTGNAPNEDVWNYDLGYGPNSFGWGNDEWQLYTRDAENIRIEDGNLVITALCDEPCGVRDGSVTSARITTNDKFEFRYGKVVARIKVPVGQGTWPAFWALGKDFPDVAWPRVGEIDFMEVFNNTNNDAEQSAIAERTATSAMHWCDESIVPNPNANCFAEGGRKFISQKLDTGSSLGDGFQIWEADWNADRVTVAINGIQYFELEIDPVLMEEFRRDFFLLLNVAMGGTLGSGGEPPQGDESFPQTMLVDYVRVYQQVDDISPPELTEVTIASNNADPGFATTGDIVTVTLTANETIQTPTVTIGGITATTLDGSGANWQASRAMTAEDAEGVIEFSVEYVDLAGNAGVPVSESTDSSRVTLDATAPGLTTVTIASDNANPSLATAGDTVTVTLAANEAIVAPVVTIGGVAAVAVGAGANWQASRVITDADADGVIPFSIAYADFAGNAGVGVPVSATTDASSVTVSLDAPTVSIVGAPVSFTTLAPIPVSFQFSKPVSGFDVGDIQVTNGAAGGFVTVDGANYTANVTPNGLGNLVIGVPAGAATDVAGNPSEAAGDVVVTSMLDPNAPLLNPINIASDNADPAYARTFDLVTLSMTATDAAGNPEAITQPTVTIAGAPAAVMMGADATSWVATRTALAGDPEGPVAFVINNFQAVDDATPGYESTVTTDGSAVIFDVTAPMLSIDGLSADIEFLEPIAVTFQFDEAVSGFDIGGIDVTNGTVGAFAVVDAATYTADITPDGVGDLTVAVAADVATDAAGNGNAAASETSVVGSAWGLVWSDDFEVDGLDAGNWTARADADCPDPCDGAQSYLTERVTVEGGLLKIEAQAGAPYTSGVIDSRDKRALKYGRVEIDAIIVTPGGAQGTLPSLRLLPAIPGGEVEPVYGPWPQSGEIDLVKAPNLGSAGNPGNTLEHTLRYGLPEPEDTATTATSVAPGVPTLDLIEYAIEWEGGEIRWFVNDVHVATQTQDNWYAYFEDADGVYTLGTAAAPFDQEFYVVIGLAVGNDADSFFPQTLQVDAVRVYECINPVNPAAGTGCSTGTVIPPVVADGDPYVEMLEVYTDAPATLDFVEPDGVTTTPATLDPFIIDAFGAVVTSTIGATDGANTVWNVDIQAAVTIGGVAMLAGLDLTRYIDLSGGGTAGELLFRMRVNSATGDPQLVAGLTDREAGVGAVPLDFVADGQWRNYSVKISDVVAESILLGSSLDIANLNGIFSIQASGGDVNLDLDDIKVKVACRDDGGCEATPRAESVPATVVYSEDFESLNAADPDALGTLGAGYIVFADVWFDVVGGLLAYTYGPFSAPNGGPGFSAIAGGEGGVDQGSQYLNIYSDYDNQDHGNNRLINTSVFREQTIIAADLGKCWTFTGDYKSPFAGGIAEPTSNATANAFSVTLDPGANFAATNDVRFDTTDASNTDWAPFSLDIDLADPLLEGQILQFGFNTTATMFEDSGVFYDNLEVSTRPGACPPDPEP
ncbi:MAG: family 16 glycosylhydrolase [Gammaproteobacteria bacterium]|nr:family 16 glycosylhydrolase [Gammaproteobacteria bacterium]